MYKKIIISLIAIICVLICISPIMAAENNVASDYLLFGFDLFGSDDSALKVDNISLQKINKEHTDADGKTEKKTNYYLKLNVDYDGDSMGNYTIDINCFDKNNKSIKVIKSYIDKEGYIKIKLPGVSGVKSANVTIYGADGSKVIYNKLINHVNVKNKITKDEPKQESTPTSSSSSSSSSSGQTYWASSNSNKFHYPSCEWAQKISGKNKVVFHSREEAINSGYVPCQVCGP